MKTSPRICFVDRICLQFSAINYRHRRLVERRIARRSLGMVVDRIIAGMGIRLLPLLFDIPAGMPRLPPAGRHFFIAPR